MYKNLIKSALEKVLNDLDVKQVNFTVERPAEEKFGDYATNVAMILAGRLKKSSPGAALAKAGPLEIAKDIIPRLSKISFVERIGIEPPGFINFYLKKESLLFNLKKINEKARECCAVNVGKGKKIVLEHTDLNPNKALHVGHLRSACLGSACENILKFLGYRAETQYYVDDTGVQVATSALGILDLDVDQMAGEKYDHYAGRAYVVAMKALEKNKQLEKKRNEIIKALDRQEGPSLDFIKKFIDLVVVANLTTTERFGINYDLLIWESDIIKSKFWEKTFALLKKCPGFYQPKSGKNKGCWVLKNVVNSNAQTDEFREKVIVKANGVVTYTGKDIAYHLWKFNLLGVDFKYAKWPKNKQNKSYWSTSRDGKSNDSFGKAAKVVNFIDSRQSFPQEIVKNSLKLLGFEKESAAMQHAGYGVVSLAPKTAQDLGASVAQDKNQYAMSGRAGLVVLADDLLELVKSKLKQKHPDAPDLEQVAIAAIKYLMLTHNTYSNIVFSYDRALDFYGNSGPYLQYSYARCSSVLKKAVTMKRKVQFSQDFAKLEFSQEEQAVLRWLLYFPETIIESGKQLAPNLLCNYLYELSGRFNVFYNKRPILRSKKGPAVIQFRLFLTAATAQVLTNGLGLLGIKPLEKM